jgi:S-adenosyl methyltransferase
VSDERRDSCPPASTDGIRYDIPQSARIWNYWMGGKDNFPIDRQAGDAVIEVNPGIVGVARQSRQFLIRAVTVLARDFGIASSSTSVRVCRRCRTPTRSRRVWFPTRGSCTSTTTPSCSRPPGRCCRTRRRRASTGTSTPRSVDRLDACFEDLELVEPGLVPITAWRPAVAEFGESAAPVDAYGALGRKP